MNTIELFTALAHTVTSCTLHPFLPVAVFFPIATSTVPYSTNCRIVQSIRLTQANVPRRVPHGVHFHKWGLDGKGV